jgi:5-methylcytosine-specific restriction protein A
MKSLTKKQILKREKRILKKELKNRWIKVRQEIKDKQNNKCYMCSKEAFGKSAHIHHIIDRRFLELFYNPLNLVLLCPRCHKLDRLSVHNSSIYFSEMLRLREPERYEYLIKQLKTS